MAWLNGLWWARLAPTRGWHLQARGFSEFTATSSSFFHARTHALPARATPASTAAPKSSGSNTWRISISDFGARHRVGAALDPFDRFFLRLHLPEPEAGDQFLGFGEGPVDRPCACRPRNFTRAPLELGCRPSPASMMPALTSSSLYLPMAVSSFSLGMMPASESLAGLDDDHESHGVVSAGFGWFIYSRTITGQIDNAIAINF